MGDGDRGVETEERCFAVSNRGVTPQICMYMICMYMNGEIL